jgi:transcriptional regulator NrdR family protein
LVLPYYPKPNAASVVVERSGAVKDFDMKKLASSMEDAGVDEESAKCIADIVKSKISKSTVSISTQKIKDIVVNKLEKENSSIHQKNLKKAMNEENNMNTLRRYAWFFNKQIGIRESY